MQVSLGLSGGNTVKRYFGWIGLCATLCIALLLAGCLTQANQQDEADKVAQQMHTAVQSQNLDAAMALYGNIFFTGHDKAAWRDKLAALHERFGALHEIKPGFFQKDPRFSGDFYIYGFKLFFERGVVHETLTVFKGINQEGMTVTGHLFKLKDEVL